MIWQTGCELINTTWEKASFYMMLHITIGHELISILCHLFSISKFCINKPIDWVFHYKSIGFDCEKCRILKNIQNEGKFCICICLSCNTVKSNAIDAKYISKFQKKKNYHYKTVKSLRLTLQSFVFATLMTLSIVKAAVILPLRASYPAVHLPRYYYTQPIQQA